MALSPDLAADRSRALALTPVSRETLDRLDRFVAVLLEWQQRMNLIASSTEPKLWTRHVADSLQLLALAPQARIWLDLGSGAGFPGVVLACALVDLRNAQSLETRPWIPPEAPHGTQRYVHQPWELNLAARGMRCASPLPESGVLWLSSRFSGYRFRQVSYLLRRGYGSIHLSSRTTGIPALSNASTIL